MKQKKPKAKAKEFREILLKVEKPVLDDLGRMLMLRKMTNNDIGADYEFGVLVFQAIMAEESEVVIIRKEKKHATKKSKSKRRDR